MEIRDALAYFRACCNLLMDLAFERIRQFTPRRGWFDCTLQFAALHCACAIHFADTGST